MFKSIGFFLYFLLFFTSANAIIIRHKREASRYLAPGSNFPSYCRINLPGGDGALIAIVRAHYRDYTGQDEANQLAGLVGHYITGTGKTGADKK
jgi:hypothetical protein